MLADHQLPLDRSALVHHLYAHLAVTMSTVRVASWIAAAEAPSGVQDVMAGLVRVVKEERVMLEALVLLLGDEDADPVHRPTAPKARAPRRETQAWRHAAADIPDPSMLPGVLDEMLVGCWSRRALWFALGERWPINGDFVRECFESLTARVTYVIDRLESLQAGAITGR